MVADIFSVPIFFIVFREALEASIIVSVLLSLTEQLVSPTAPGTRQEPALSDESDTVPPTSSLRRRNDYGERERLLNTEPDNESSIEAAKLVRSLQVQVYAGAAAGLALALAIGAVFLVIWYTQVIDVFGRNEEIWEGAFSFIASILILVMALAVLRIEKSKDKWSAKLQRSLKYSAEGRDGSSSGRDSATNGRYSLFLLPFVTVLREGVEAIVFIGGVSLAQAPSSIPLATLLGLLLGLLVGFLIYRSSSRTPLSIFLICSTNFLLVLGAGLLSKSVGAYERYQFNQLTGGDAAEQGNGPGSYPVVGNLWHLNCCNPENKLDAKGWAVLNSLVGWSNNGSVGTVGAYIIYWLVAITALTHQKRRERQKSQIKAHDDYASEDEDMGDRRIPSNPSPTSFLSAVSWLYYYPLQKVTR